MAMNLDQSISVRKGNDVYINVIDIKRAEIVARVHPFNFTSAEMAFEDHKKPSIVKRQVEII
jgi:hypothetical protein